MNIEIINTGSELLLGRVLNTHQQWLCRRLSDLGYEVSRLVCVPDQGEPIRNAVKEALQRADLVLTTGGLGPTSDDITRDLVAELLGRKLVLDTAILDKIEKYFLQRKRPMPASTGVQAMVFEGGRVLPNHFGTAPGLAIEVDPNPFAPGKKSWLIMLPGPPRELHPLFDNHVVPLLKQELPPKPFACRILRVAGSGESVVEETIAAPLKPFLARGLELGYCARTGEVDVRLVCRGSQAASVVAEAEAVVRSLLEKVIFAKDDETMESTVVQLLTQSRQTLTLAESCTGGFIANRITNVPGASAVLMSGLVTYSNESKMNLLGVSAQTLQEHGAVSQEVAREMALGARQRFGTDYALSVTGIAGPGGGSEAKPVGTVFIAVAHSGGVSVQGHFFPMDRETFKFVTSQQALDLLRRTVSKL